MMYRNFIRALQFVSIFLMWGFATSVLGLVAWLITVAIRWQDALNWTLAISLVMTPVYLTVAGTLTYVFIGVQRGAPPSETKGSPEPKTGGGAKSGGAGGSPAKAIEKRDA